MTDIESYVIEALRAKSRENNKKYDKNLLLKDHLKETILRALEFRNFVEGNKNVFHDTVFNDDLYKSLIIACFLHDLGKINWKFQLKLYGSEEKRYDSNSGRYVDDKLNKLNDFFYNYRDIDISDHEVISLIYSYIFLDNSEWDKKIRTAILLHHYNNFYTNKEINIRYIFDEYEDLTKYVDFLIAKKESIKKILNEFIDCIFSDLNNDNDFINEVLRSLKNGTNNLNKLEELRKYIKKGGLSTKLKLFEIPDQVDKSEEYYKFFVFLGCLRRCDHAASANIGIEYNANLKYTLYNKLDERIKHVIGRQEIWQEEIVARNNYNNMILIAPTGSGKTEFALLWAQAKGKKLVYTLPLRVALNDLYSRFSKNDTGYFNRDYVRVLHSTSFIEYLKEEGEGTILSIDEKENSAELFSSPLILTTPDQALLSSLKYYGFDKLASIYPLSTIIIDEIQAYNPEMAAVIIKTLEMINELKGNILIITATFPPYFKDLLISKEIIKENEIIDLKELSSKDFLNKVKGYFTKRHKISIIRKSFFDYDNSSKDRNNENLIICKEYKQIIHRNKGKKILIIVNNVSKAIKLYEELKNEVDNEVCLLHSRLLEKEKGERIKRIKEELKKPDGSSTLILVSTQIVEASVDIDFDILITELSPIDSQIQRWGRIWRNRFDKNGQELNYEGKDPNIYIFVGENIDKGTIAIYDKESLYKTAEVLKKHDQELLDYEKERELINEVYEGKLLEYYKSEIEKNLDWLKYFSAEKRSEAQAIFRRIGGVQVLIPELMENSDDEIEKEFYNIIIKDRDKWKLPWESNDGNSIIELLQEKLGKRQEINKWRLREILYSYSINLPLFAYQTYKSKLSHDDFKGFIVLSIHDKEIDKKIKILNDIKEYGIDKLWEGIDDEEEINRYEEDNII